MPESSSFDEEANYYTRWTIDEKMSLIAWYHRKHGHIRGEELRHMVNTTFNGLECSRYMAEMIITACPQCELTMSFKSLQIQKD